MKDNSLWKKGIDILTIIILGLGVLIGYKALREYKNQNNAQMINTLLGGDIEILRMTVENKYLQGLFALSPKGQDAKSNAIQMLQVITNDVNDNFYTEWKDIPELHAIIFGSKEFNNENKHKLREAILISETIIDDISSAFEANEFGLIKKEDYETYVGNFPDIGENPLFLCAVYWYHRNGYITKTFAHEIKKRLLTNPQRKSVIEAIYPDLLKDDWISRVGEAK